MLAINRLVFLFILLFIVVFHTAHIFFAAYNSFFDYDLGKVVSYLDLYPGFLPYIGHLRFGQGIATQVYWLGQITDLTPRFLKIGSYIFFVLTFIFTLYQVRPDDHADQNTMKLALVAAAASTLVFFSSNLLKFLGSYGMLVYCQTFFLGALLLYFAQTHIWSQKHLDLKASVKWFLIFVLGTFLDVRLSFYLGMAFATGILLDINDWNGIKKKVLLGSVLGTCLILPIGAQFYFRNDGFIHYKPHHALNLFYDGVFQFREMAAFLQRNTIAYLETLVGTKSIYQIAFLTFLVVGVASEIRFRTGRAVVFFLSLCLLIQAIAALFGIYPFGSVKYTTPLFAFLLYLFLSGVSFAFMNSIKRIPMPTFRVALVGVVIVLSGWISLPEIKHSMAHTQRIYDREHLVIETLKGFADDEVWCDIASEKIALGYKVRCQLMATWNYQTGIREKEEFYAKLDEDLSKVDGEIAFFLFRPFGIPFFDPVRDILNEHSIVVTDQLHGQSHIYLLEKHAD